TDHDCVDPRVADQVLPVAVDPGYVELARDASGRLATAIADPNHLDSPHALEAGDVARTGDLSSPDDPDANLPRTHRPPHDFWRCKQAARLGPWLTEGILNT